MKPSSHPSERTAEGRWFLAALGAAQVCSWGSLYYSFPLIAEAMGGELGWSKPQLYGAATLGLALSAVAAYPVGAAIDRGHGRIVMTAASLLAGVLLIAWSQVTQLFWFYLVFAGIGCLHAATLYEPAFAVVARRFGATQARRGITALTLWGGFASTVFVPLIQTLIDHLDWRGALIALSFVNIVVCAALYFAAIQPRRDAAPDVRASGKGFAPLQGRRAVVRSMRSPVFWALALAFLAYGATIWSFTFHLYPLLLERGLGASEVVTVIAIIGPAQVLGRIALWRLAPDTAIARVGSVSVGVMLAFFIVLVLAPPSLVVLAFLAAIYGLANGILTIVRGMAVPEMLTTSAYGAINGALIVPMVMAKALAPLAAAGLWATSGSYDAVLIAISSGAGVLALSFWLAAALSMRTRGASAGTHR